MSIFTPASVAFLFVGFGLFLLFPARYKKYILLLISLSLFAATSGWGVLYVAAVGAAIWCGGLLISRFRADFERVKKELPKEERKAAKKKTARKISAVRTCCVLFCLLILAVLKYNNLFGSAVNGLVGEELLPAVRFLLPLGISYYTLMAISYIVDVARGTVECEKNPAKVLLYLCWTPHIIEGPFDTYASFSEQLDQPVKFGYDRFMDIVCLLLCGLFKKLVIADRLSYLSNEVFGNVPTYAGLAAFLGIAAFAVSLYFDFSGCIDIVRSISELFGIRLAENFNRPFFSGTVQEFWRRWHISFGTWLKNYVFYPVSLSRLGTKLSAGSSGGYFRTVLPTVLPLFCVWTVMGIWHGADFRYLVYGLYFFAVILTGILLEPALLAFFRKTGLNRDGVVMRICKTLRTLLLGFTLFRAESLTDFGSLIASLFRPGDAAALFAAISDVGTVDIVIAAVCAAACFALEFCAEKGNDLYRKTIGNPYGRWIFITLMIAVILFFGIYGSGYSGQTSIYADF